MTTTERPQLTETEIIGKGVSCIWIPGRRYSQRQAAHEQSNQQVLIHELNRFGFMKARVRQVNETTRELELLGPDSPAEFVFSYQPIHPDIDETGGHYAVDDLTRQMLFWVWERYGAMLELKGKQTHGERTL